MKDPAFLFYSNDFLSGTMLMSDEQIGQYIKLLCLQHQKGHLKEKDMLIICKTYDDDIFSKFVKDEEGNYYNVRLEEEVERRKKYSESRRNNRKSKKTEKNKNICVTYDDDMNNICNSYEEHMETETETETETININKNNEEKLQKKFIECIGSTNLNAINECISYLDDLPYEVIELALEKTSEVNGKWKYTKAILQRWLEAGINTVEQVKSEELQYKNKKNEKELSGLEKWAKKMEEKEKLVNGV